jgi:hypothetical protein
MLKGGSDVSNDDPFASEPSTGKNWVQTGPLVTAGVGYNPYYRCGSASNFDPTPIAH